MLRFSRDLIKNLYIFSCFIAFIVLFYLYFAPLQYEQLVGTVLFSILAALFDWKAITMPSGEEFSLVTPILFAAGVVSGIQPLFYIVALMFVFVSLINLKRWKVMLFNCLQYGLSTSLGVLSFQLVGGKTGETDLTNPVPYLAFAIAFFLTNASLVSLYLLIQEGRAAAMGIIGIYLEKNSLMVYFTMMALGLLLAIVYSAQGLIGVIIFCVIMWGLGLTYRQYYSMYNHFRSLSIRDELTGLYNHRYFQEQLEKQFQIEQEVSLVLMDLDYFKVYNDMFGHPKGDELLKKMAEELTATIPEQGILCRYGGEEFALILPHTSSAQALNIAETIRKHIASTQFFGMEHMPNRKITVSIGVSNYPTIATSKENLIMLADQALYKVKYTSRNKVQLYSSVIDELRSNFQFGEEESEIVQTIRTFLTIINSKDRYTYGHTERNMEYAEALASKLGLGSEEIKYIRYGALLHDIGKVEVPTEVLNKSTRLTDEEWETIKMHVLWGEQIVEPIKELAPCLPIIRSHHERFDGKGYPDRLEGAQIPLSARILTVVDSFDAMTTNRPYQKVKSIHEAIDELRRCAGTQFDPDLVEPFIEVIQELRLDKSKDSA